MTRLTQLIFVIASLALGAGCAMSGAPAFSSGAPGEFGATPGGVQDMGLARALVEEGRVPPAEAFVVEGMFSEHDLPVSGGACADVLCIGAAGAIAPNLDEQTRAWVQIGLSSTVNPETYERPPATIIATVDVSGSMGWSYGDTSPGELSRALLERMAAELGEGDRIAIVTYGSSVATPLPLTSGANSGAINAAIAALGEGGSTNMEAGLQRAYAIARAEAASGHDVRVLLFTDVQPNVGATSPSEFQAMVQAGADEGVGITVFGMGVGLGQELFEAMSHLRGGNAFSLMAADDVPALMEESWPFLLTPIAYDLRVAITPSTGTSVLAGYGFPGAEEDGSAALEVASVFLSRKRGALLVELGRADDLPIAQAGATLALEYTRPNGTPVSESLAVDWSSLSPDERGHAYAQPATGRTVALALAVTGMHDAAALYASDGEASVALARATAERLSADAEALDDDALRAEAAFAGELLALMEAGAAQGNLYGY